MPAQDTDRNLLFGILALQNNFINREALLAAFTTWVVEKQRPLGEILCEQGKLTQLQDELLRALTEQHVKQHGNNPERSLAAVSSVGSMRDELRKLGDPQLEASLAAVALRPPGADPYATILPSTCDWAGHSLRFRVLRPHAKGGLGEVFVAQDLELHREVALKEIQSRFADQPDSRSRFVLEAEITGGLEHPGIVPVYGLGQYADGRPFYAMRFIRGASLAEAIARFHRADGPGRDPGERSLELRKLLGRFVDVCEAIEYAHSRGILHRDLKPGNVMLGKYGETLVVDWGLAKSVGRGERTSETGETTLQPSSGDSVDPTLLGKAIGTPAYMSPEQAAGRLNDLGPASDVYSLGATLYSLMVGQPPFSGNDKGEILSRVERGDFPRPREVKPLVPAALQAICLKSMALQPADRYSSPQMLAEDIEHWLADEPVGCYSEPPLVQARRWVNRHPTLVVGTAATVLISFVSLAAIATVVGQSNRALATKKTELDAKNRQLAQANTDLEAANVSERSAKQDADQKRSDAEKARREGQQLLDFFTSVLRLPDPSVAAYGAKTPTVAEMFDLAANQLESTFPNQPLIQAQLLNAIGQTYHGLGLNEKAIMVFERARDLYRNDLGEDHEDTLATMNELGVAYQSAGRLAEAVPLLEHALKLAEARLGPEHPNSLTVMNNLASAYRSAGRLPEGLQLHEKTLASRKVQFGLEHPKTLTSMNNMALLLQSAGRLEEALPLFKKTLELRNVQLGPEHPDTLTSMNNLGLVYNSLKRHEEALLLWKQTLELRKASLGPKHPSTLTSMGNLANAFGNSGRLAEALPLYEQTLELSRETHGPDHPATLTTMNNLAAAYASAGRPEEALPLYEQTLALRKAKLGPEDPSTLISMNNLAVAYKNAGRLAEALPLYEQTLELKKAKLGPAHPSTLTVTNNLAKAYLAAEQPQKALPLFDQLIAGHRGRATPDDPAFAGLLAATSHELLQHRQYPDAETYLRECLAIREKKIPDDWVLFNTQSMLGDALSGQKKFQDAEPLLVKGYQGMKDRETKIPPTANTRLSEAVQRLVDLYTAWDKPEKAAEWQTKLDAEKMRRAADAKTEQGKRE